jgi:hypothetical protein
MFRNPLAGLYLLTQHIEPDFGTVYWHIRSHLFRSYGRQTHLGSGSRTRQGLWWRQCLIPCTFLHFGTDG